MGACLVDGCELVRWVRGLCERHYRRHLRTGAYADMIMPPRAPDIARDQGYRQCCDRCMVQLGALAGDDRPLLAGTMTMAEASAYMLGFHDGRVRYSDEAVDPLAWMLAATSADKRLRSGSLRFAIPPHGGSEI